MRRGRALLLACLLQCRAAGAQPPAPGDAVDTVIADADARLVGRACSGDAVLSLFSASAFSGCASLAGSVRMSPSFAVPTLRGAFAMLQAVRGDVDLHHTTLVDMAAAFPKLTAVGGSIRIWANERLLGSDVAPAFPELTDIGGNLLIQDAPVRSLMAEFPALRRIGGTLTLADLPRLTAWDSRTFRALTFANGVHMRNYGLAEAKRAFPRLTEVGSAGLVLANLMDLATIGGAFAALRRVGGDLALLDCPSLALAPHGALSRVRSVGSLRVRGTALKDLSFLLSLSVVAPGGVELGGNAKMLALDGLQNLRFVGGALDLAGLSQTFGDCGSLSSAGLFHRCYSTQYRLCQPGFKSDAAARGVAYAGAVSAGTYACVETAMTWLNSTTFISITAGALRATGLDDELASPLADVTVLAPDDRAWLAQYGSRGFGGPLLSALGVAALTDILKQSMVRGARTLLALPHAALLPTWAGTRVLAVSFLGARTPWETPRCAGAPGFWAPCLLKGWAAKQVMFRTLFREDDGDEQPRIPAEAEAEASPCDGMCGLCSDVCCCEPGCVLAGDCCDGAASACAALFSDEPVAAQTSTPPAPTLLAALAATLHSGAWLTQPDLKGVNGVVQVVNALLLPPGVPRQLPALPRAAFPPRPPSSPPSPPRPPPALLPAGKAPPSASGAYAAMLPTNSSHALYGSVPSWAVVSPPPSQFPPPSPPPLPPPRSSTGLRGSCRAVLPNICGQCDYTFSAAGGACCCDTSCTTTGDCCPDYVAACLVG